MNDDALEADLRRVCSAVDPPPPLGVHPSHRPELPEQRALAGLTSCTVCCLVIATSQRACIAGLKPCRGPGAIELREAS